MVRARSKSAIGARQRSPRLQSASAARAAFQSVQLAGISDRLPSGSTTSNSRVPRRRMVPMTCNARPSNACRSRRIVAELKMSWRWVVCGNFL
jgi:hypothetical protein